MKCETARKLISRYIDQELSGEEELLLFSHLDSCDTCSLCYADYQKISSYKHGISLVATPANFTDIVLRQIERERLNSLVRWRNRLDAILLKFNRAEIASAAVALAMIYTLALQPIGRLNYWQQTMATISDTTGVVQSYSLKQTTNLEKYFNKRFYTVIRRKR